jgi:hypothetical protein
MRRTKRTKSTDNFIDDGHSTRPSRDQLDQPYTSWNQIINSNDNEEIFSDLLRRAHQRSQTHRPGISALVENEDNHGNAIRARPSVDDYPLWQIKCRVSLQLSLRNYVYNQIPQLGLEEEAVFYLLQRAETEHELRSAFTRGSIWGWIYLETTMNTSLLDLLKHTPGVISSRQGVLRGLFDLRVRVRVYCSLIAAWASNWRRFQVSQAFFCITLILVITLSSLYLNP